MRMQKGEPMKIELPQIIVLFLYAMGLGAHLMKHGEPLEGKYDVVAKTIAVAIMIALLKWGGFFG